MVSLKNRSFLVLFALVYSLNGYALGVANHFTVQEVRTDSSGKGMAKFSSLLVAEGQLPTCSTHDYHLAFDTNEPAGMAILSLLLAAQATGKTVYAKGTGECDVYSVVETWAWGRIE